MILYKEFISICERHERRLRNEIYCVQDTGVLVMILRMTVQNNNNQSKQRKLHYGTNQK